MEQNTESGNFTKLTENIELKTTASNIRLRHVKYIESASDSKKEANISANKFEFYLKGNKDLNGNGFTFNVDDKNSILFIYEGFSTVISQEAYMKLNSL